MFGSHQRVGAANGVRRFFQFGLRTLLIAMTAFSVWLGVYQVTSKGLAHLTRLKKLTGLYLTGGDVDTRDFERALPNCKVQR